MQYHYDDATVLDVARRTVKHMVEIVLESFKTKDQARLRAYSLMGRFIIVDNDDYSDPPNVLVDLNFPLKFAKPPTSKLLNMIITELDSNADVSQYSWLGTIERDGKTIWVHVAKLNGGVDTIFWAAKPDFITS